MVGSALGLSLGIGEAALSARAGGGVAGPAAPVPANWDFIAYGDSRTENALSGGLTGGGYEAASTNLGPAAWLPQVSGNRLRLARYPNYGISASTTMQGAAIPRQTNAGGVTASSPAKWQRGSAPAQGDSTNKGADYAAASGAGMVLILYGTNDGDAAYPVASRTAMTTILNALAPGQVKLLFNDTPKGFRADGSDAGQGTSAAFAAYAAWIGTLDYASGHANARPDVIVVDSWAEMLDPATGRNKVGYLRDGLHFTPWGARRLAQVAHARLEGAYGIVYTGLPARAPLPVSNGATVAGDAIGVAHGAFVHTNPLMTPGGNGTVQGANFATAPLASTIPQGWIVAGQNNGASIAVTVDKAGIDPDGYPMTTLAVSGSLKAATFTGEISGTTLTVTAVAAGAIEPGQIVNYGSAGQVTITAQGSGTGGAGTYAINFAPGTVSSTTMTSGGTYTLQFYQQAQQPGQLTVNDRLRGVGRIRVETGSQLLQRVQLRTYVQDATAARSQSAIVMAGSAGGINDRGGYLLNSSGYDAAGQSEVLLTQLLDLQDPNMATAGGGPGTVATINNCIFYIESVFANFTGNTRPVSATIRASRAGVIRV